MKIALPCVAQFVIVLDVTIVAIALPAVQADLGFSTAALGWVITAYTLVFGGCLLVAGRLADRLGRRRTFALGLAVFAAASLACGLAPTSSGAARRARAIQGIGAALVSPAALGAGHLRAPDGPARAARSAGGPPRRPAAARAGGCWAASSAACSTGAGSSSSTSRSAPRRRAARPARARRVARPRTRRALDLAGAAAGHDRPRVARPGVHADRAPRPARDRAAARVRRGGGTADRVRAHGGPRRRHRCWTAPC